MPLSVEGFSEINKQYFSDIIPKVHFYFVMLFSWRTSELQSRTKLLRQLSQICTYEAFVLLLPTFPRPSLVVNGWSQKIFSKKQTETLRRKGKTEYFWAEGVVFASQFGESGFDFSVSTGFVRDCSNAV